MPNVKVKTSLLIFLPPTLPTFLGFYVQPEVVTFTISAENIIVQEGGRVELRCAFAKQNRHTATNLPHPTIQWLVNGTGMEEV